MAKVHLTTKAAQKLASVVEQVDRSSDTLLQPESHEAPPQRMQLGIIVENGPDGEDDFEDARYWVQSAFVSNDTNNPDEPAEVTVYEMDRPGRFAIRPVTNLGEIEDQSHGLDVGQIVRTWHQPDRSENPASIRRWLMAVMGGGSTRFCIVRGLRVPTGHELDIQLVRKREGAWRTHGDIRIADTYPVMMAKFYEGLVVLSPSEEVNQGWPVLELHGNVVHPWSKVITPGISHADGVRGDDCNPMQGVGRP